MIYVPKLKINTREKDVKMPLTPVPFMHTEAFVPGRTLGKSKEKYNRKVARFAVLFGQVSWPKLSYKN